VEDKQSVRSGVLLSTNLAEQTPVSARLYGCQLAMPRFGAWSQDRQPPRMQHPGKAMPLATEAGMLANERAQVITSVKTQGC
jgi:hypothetical protein